MSESADVPVLADAHQEDRLALRALLRAVADAINGKDWDALKPLLDENVILTMLDQVTLRGQTAMEEYATSKLGRFSSILADLKVDPVVDEPAAFYGDTAVCTLSSADRFVFRNGRDLLVQTKYTATLVKRDGKWRLVALHSGTNAFNNPISYQAHRLLTGGIAVAGVGGALLGWLLCRKEG